MKASTRARKDAEKTERAKVGAKLAKATTGPFEHQPEGPGAYRTADGQWHRGPTGSG